MVYVRHTKKGKAAYWLYHAPNLVLQLLNKAPRTGPLVADMEMGDGSRLLLAMSKKLTHGHRYNMSRKVDSSGKVSFVAGDKMEGEVSSRGDVTWVCSSPARFRTQAVGMEFERSETLKDLPSGLHQKLTLRASDVAAAAVAGPSAAAGGSAAGDWREAARRRKLVIRDRCPWGHPGCCAYPSKALGWPARCIC